MPKPVIKMTTVDLTQEIADSGQVDKLAALEEQYSIIQKSRNKSIELSRVAAIAAANAQIAASQEQAALVEFLRMAGEISPIVASEGVWMRPFKRGSNIIMESPMTTKDARKAARLTHVQMNQAAHTLQDQFGDIFGNEDEEEERE